MRSLMCLISAAFLRITKVNDHNFMKEFNRVKNKGEQDWFMKRSLIGYDFESENYDNMKVYYVNKHKDCKSVLFYIHGGYYFHHAAKSQLTMLRKIIKQTNSLIVFPVYPLVPFHTVDENFETMKSLFECIQKEYSNSKVVLAGDSAGGGYALALAESIKKQPDELILLSPWVDATMNNEKMWNYDRVDPMLSIEKARFIGKLWAGEKGPKDPRVSPLFGNLTGLNNVSIFVGTREVFYPDNILLFNKLKDLKVANAQLIVGDKQNHVYPAYPTPEAKKAVKQIADIINR